jgi:hypothetical protein
MGENMSSKVFSIDRVLYEILSELPHQPFSLRSLRVEYSKREDHPDLPATRYLFWSIYMQMSALKNRKLARRELGPDGKGVFFLEQEFFSYPFAVVDRMFFH